MSVERTVPNVIPVTFAVLAVVLSTGCMTRGLHKHSAVYEQFGEVSRVALEPNVADSVTVLTEATRYRHGFLGRRVVLDRRERRLVGRRETVDRRVANSLASDNATSPVRVYALTESRGLYDERDLWRVASRPLDHENVRAGDTVDWPFGDKTVPVRFEPEYLERRVGRSWWAWPLYPFALVGDLVLGPVIGYR